MAEELVPPQPPYPPQIPLPKSYRDVAFAELPVQYQRRIADWLAAQDARQHRPEA